MKTIIYDWDFIHCDALKDNFSYDGRAALFCHFEQVEDDCGIEIDFDPIAIRCEYTEYANLDEFWQDYNSEQYQCISDIEDATTVIKIPDSEAFIIYDF